MQDLIQTIDLIGKRIEKHKDALAGNEAMTRYTLIDPLLKVLGWDVSDPCIVTPEDGGTGVGRIDYTMGKSVAVEAKKFGERLDKHADQIISSVKNSKVRYGILTNGRTWRLYDSWESMSTIKTEFDILSPIGVVIRKAANLHRLVVEERLRQSEPNGNKSSNSVNGRLPIRDIKRTTGMAPPVELICPDETMPMQSWTDVLVGVTTWLVKKNYLNKSHCPVARGHKNDLLNSSPVHQKSGMEMKPCRQVGTLYLNMSAVTQSVPKYAVRLIEIANQNPDDFLVRFADSKKT